MTNNFLPYTQGNILTPSINVLPKGMERYPIDGGTARLVEIFAGDEIILEDREGLQPCELAIFDQEGTFDAGLIGSVDNCQAEGSCQILQSKGANSPFRTALDKSQIDLTQLKALRIFDQQSAAGNRASFVASGDGKMIVSAIGEDMSAHEQNVPTEIVLHIKRAKVDEQPLFKPARQVNISKSWIYRVGNVQTSKPMI